MRAEGRGRLVLRGALWLPVALAAWYLASGFLAAILAPPVARVVNLFHPNLVAGVAHSAGVLEFDVSLRAWRDGVAVALSPEVETRIYTCGLALLLAATLASRTPPARIALGVALLLPVQAFSIAADLLAQVVLRSDPAFAAQVQAGPIERELIALAYQVGSLLLPTLAPVAIWFGLERSLVPIAQEPQAT